MAFNLRARPTSFQWEVTGQIDQNEFRFIGVFRALTTEEADGYLAQIATLDNDLRNGVNSFTAIAHDIFLGWVNLPSEPSTWVREAGPDSPAVDCSPDALQEMFSQAGVCRSICLAYFSALNADTARLGNSEHSPAPGMAP
jgi:hypothetical protein